MSDNGIGKPEDFRRAVERTNVERVVLPASGLTVLLCRPPVFAALAIGKTGTQLQARITEAKSDQVQPEAIEAFTAWLNETLARLFVEPRFAATPDAVEIGLSDLLIDDLKFIFRWLRGEILASEVRGPKSEVATEDLGRFPGRQGSAALSGGGGAAQFVPAEPVA